MSEKDKSKSGSQTKHTPKDAQVIMSILKEAGVTEYEPRVVNQLLEFTFKYVSSILDEAKVYAAHAKKKNIDIEDVRLAAQMQLDKFFTGPPPREVLLEIARVKNINPLPLIKPHCGLRLPPDRYCLSACNFRLKPAAKKVSSLQKTAAVTKLGISNVVKRNTMPTIVSTPKPNIIPKPVLKFTSSSKQVIAKPAVRVTSGPAPTKMEVDDSSNKRKREDDEYDV